LQNFKTLIYITGNSNLHSNIYDTPHPCPLPQGERVYDNPSLDGRGRGG